MQRWLMIAGISLLITGCAMTTYDHPTKTAPMKLADEVECKALARTGAGTGFGLVYELAYTDLLVKCLKGRGWDKAGAPTS